MCDDADEPRLPARSRLYSLAPEGVGTPRIESLTSYLTRLAAAHGWPTRILMEREIGPRLGWTSSLTTLLKNGAYCLNGSGEAADKGVAVLEQLTRQSDLLRLTLLPWRAVFARRALLRVTRAWCPRCYEQWRAQGTPIYEPLIWAVAAVTVCASHRRRLATRCPHCGVNHQPMLASWSLPGHCFSCGAWLGSAKIGASSSEEQRWIAEVVGELLATSDRTVFAPRAVVAALACCIDQCTQGNIAAFATLLQRPRNTVWLWCSGQVIPSLPLVLHLCRQLGLTPAQFLSGADHATGIPVSTSHARSGDRSPTRKTPVPFDRQSIRAALERVLQEENVTPSMREAARRVGCDSGVLYHQFPALCRQIAARSRVAAARRGEQRIGLLCRTVQDMVFALHGNGKEPTRRTVEARLPNPGILRDPTVRRAFRTAVTQCQEARKE